MLIKILFLFKILRGFLIRNFILVLFLTSALFITVYVSYVRAEPGEKVSISVEKIGSDKFSLKLKSDKAVLDWLIFPVQDYLNSKRGSFSGLPTGDGINCQKQFERTAIFSEEAFPLRITLQACDENSTGWGHKERTFAFTFNKPGKMFSDEMLGASGFITPLLSERVSEKVRNCVRNAPDGSAMFSDWQRWTSNPENLRRDGFTLETREIINMCAWQQSGVENPFLQSPDGEPPLPEISRIEIKFPIQELGNCGSESACRAYCETDDPGRIRTCLQFAKNNKILTKEDLDRGEKFADILERGGPGGCKSETECVEYCNNTDHIDVCLDFAESHGFLPENELNEARKIQATLKTDKSLPGNCKSKKECESYCAEATHMRVCIDFAKGAGLLSGQELAEAEKVLPLIESGETPGKCVSKVQCETYCADDSHFDECVAFGERAGFLNKQEAEAIRKSGGKTPGGCKSKEQCEAYCGNSQHFKECANFAVQTGLYTPEELEKIKEEKSRKIISGVEKELNNCLVKSCADALVCLMALEASSKAKGFGGQESLPANLTEKLGAKLQICTAEMSSGNDSGSQGSTQTSPSLEVINQNSAQNPEQYKLTPEQCQSFSAVPKCDYVGPADSQNYNYCKQCFPDK